VSYDAGVAGFVGEDVERRETDGVPRRAANLGKNAGVNGCRRQNSVVVQALDRSVGKIHRPSRQPGFNERVR